MITLSYRFWTRQFFKDWRQRFYPNGKKVVPNNLGKLSPITMAIWYMDDGSLMEQKRIILSTDSFDKVSLEIVKQVIKESFDVKSIIKGNGKLLIGTKQTLKLGKIIWPEIIQSMSYKIP